MPSHNLIARSNSFLVSVTSLRIGAVSRRGECACRTIFRPFLLPTVESTEAGPCCPSRRLSIGPSDGSSKPPGGTVGNAFLTNNARDLSPHTPGWVSTHKTNGERRMSVSIRSGAQRQRARRPPHVPPHAPPPPLSTTSSPVASSSHPAARDTEPQATLPSNGGQDKALRGGWMATLSTNAMGERSESPASPLPATAASHPSKGVPEASASSPKPASSHRKAGAAPKSEGAAASSATAAATNKSAATASNASSHPLLYSVSRFTEPVKRIILIRNGRSEANEDVAAYVNTPDWRIPLVEEGKRESIAAGRALSELTGDDPVYFYYSPYIRSRQSLRYVLQGFDEARLSGPLHTREWWEEEEGDISFESPRGPEEAMGSAGAGLPLETQGIATISAEQAGYRGGEVANAVSADPTTDIASASFLQHDTSLVLNQGTSDSIIGVREDVRLRDGDIGRYTTVEELMHHLLERERYGKFFYRFPYGESGADVCDRVTSFLDAFQRERVEFPMNTNVVIITHGLTMRMFIKRWFHLTVETFHRMKSPPPGSLCTLTRLHHRSCFRLDESCVESMNLPLSLNEYNGYKYRNKQLLGSMSSGAPYM